MYELRDSKKGIEPTKTTTMKTNTILLEQPSRKIETERMLPLMSQVETITKQSKEPNTKLKEDLELL